MKGGENMNVESLDFSKTVKAEPTKVQKTSSKQKFSDLLTTANSSDSQNNVKSENVPKDSNEVSSQKKVETTSTDSAKTVQEDESKKVEDTKEEASDSQKVSQYTFDLTSGLEGLLGTVSKLADAQKKDSDISIEDLLAIMNASTLQDLNAATGLALDEDDLSGKLSLDNLLEKLGINKEDLQNTIQQLTGKKASTDDVWKMLENIGQNAVAFVQNLFAAIKGDTTSKISKDQASQLLQVLKVIEVVAPKTDLLLKQEYQTFQVKELLSTLSTKAESIQAQNTKTDLPFAKLNDSQTLTVKLVDSNGNDNVSTLSSTVKTSTTTVTLTLPANKAAQGEAFVKEFQAIMNRSQFSNNAAGTKLLIKLYPENLGSIRVELMQKDGVMTARFLASTAVGKQMLESQLQQLKQGLVNQNIQLDRIDVSQALTETNRNERDHQQSFQHSFKQQSQEQHKEQKDDDDEKVSFNDILMDLEV